MQIKKAAEAVNSGAPTAVQLEAILFRYQHPKIFPAMIPNCIQSAHHII